MSEYRRFIEHQFEKFNGQRIAELERERDAARRAGRVEAFREMEAWAKRQADLCYAGSSYDAYAVADICREEAARRAAEEEAKKGQ